MNINDKLFPNSLAGVRPLPNPIIRNRFDEYQDPYSYEDQKSFMDELYAIYEEQINKGAAEDTADLQQGAASRMASRGITGGSIVDDTLGGIATDVGKSKYSALSNLKTGKAGGLLGLQNLANQRKLQTTGMASNVDLQNFMNQIKQLGLLSDIDFRQSYLDLQEEQQPGWLEDLFSGIGDIASLVPGLGNMGFFDLFKGGDGGSDPSNPYFSVPRRSDIRLKENISKVGFENGFNIYDFNYIGNPRRFRGVVADEVEMTRPDAVTTINGIKHVFYDKIGIKFQEV